MAWTTPGTATAGEVLTAAFWNTNVRDNINSLSRGVVEYASNSSQTSLATTVADISGASITWTREASHNYLVIACVTGIIKQTNAGSVTLTITDGSNNVAATFFQVFAVDGTSSKNWIFEWINNASAGSITRKLRQVTSSAGGVFNRADVGDNGTFIAVLDLGDTSV